MTDLLSLFPSGSALDADGVLSIDSCRADALATEFGTPVLVHSGHRGDVKFRDQQS